MLKTFTYYQLSLDGESYELSYQHGSDKVSLLNDSEHTLMSLTLEELDALSKGLEAMRGFLALREVKHIPPVESIEPTCVQIGQIVKCDDLTEADLNHTFRVVESYDNEEENDLIGNLFILEPPDYQGTQIARLAGIGWIHRYTTVERVS